MSGQGSTPITVHTLTCHDHVWMARQCLGSLLAYSANPIKLVIHDDGSLTEVDREMLRASLVRCSFVSKREADERMAPLLARFPATRKFREQSVMGIKMLDSYYLEDGEILAYCDSDVLFFHPFRDLFFLNDPATGIVTMKDHLQSYSIYPWHLERQRQLRLTANVNGGLLTFRRNCYDPELVEWFWSLPDLRAHNKWLEQTCWAMLASRVNACHWDPRQVRIIAGMRDLRTDLIAGHFVTPFRRFLPRDGGARSSRDVVRVNIVPARRCRPIALLRDELIRAAARWSSKAVHWAQG
jgi:hypothetical protein